ncbi:MAG: lanthionine synthetase LanC family protein, partial [Acidimicrobiia bacterium]
LTPAGVARALTGGPAPNVPRTAPSDPPDAASVTAGVAHWLCHRLGAGTGGHLWPTGPTGTPLDPVNVQSGASGVGLFLARAAGVMDDDHALRRTLATTAAWVSQQVADGPPRPPGLYFGLSGVAWFLTEAGTVLDRGDLTRRANELALALPVLFENPDLSHGTAGIGLGQLHHWLRTGDDRFLARAVLAAEHLVRTVERIDGGFIWSVPASAPSRLAGTRSYGYAHGTAGIAGFLLYVAAASGEEQFATTAIEALDGLLGLAQDGAGGSAWWPSGPDDLTCWPHWCNGSSGVGTALLRAHVWTGQRRYLNAAVAAARAGLIERWRSSTVQCHGLAGDAELLLDLAAVTGDEGYRAQARQAAASLWLRRRDEGNSIVFPDDTGGAVSAAFGTGMAGVGSFFLRLAAGGPRPFMLDELLPRSRGGRSRRFRSSV